MNIERFAGDNEIMQLFATQIQANDAVMRQRQQESMNNAYEQRARDVRATGVKNANLYLLRRYVKAERKEFKKLIDMTKGKEKYSS